MTWSDRYGSDVLRPGPGRELPQVTAAMGLVVEDIDTGWVGAITHLETSGGMQVVALEDSQGRSRSFPVGPGFLVDGAPVCLLPASRGPAARGSAVTGPGRTASGSVAVQGARARVARGSRIWVEGQHDAELVEKVWGDDLRVEGVVVEPLQGIDDLGAAVAEFSPGPGRRLGVLVDHLVPGSKEWRVTREVLARARAPRHVLVLGHPYVDIWQAVRPSRVGLRQWPEIERGVEWKHGVLAHLGWPHDSPGDVAAGWRRILSSVRDYADLEPALLGRVEELIDFVAAE